MRHLSLPSVALLACLSWNAAAQVPTLEWDAVQRIAPGTMVRIDADNTKRVVSRLDTVSDLSLTVKSGVVRSFDRPQIVGVAVKKPGHRVRNTFIGMGLGAAVGLGIGAIASAGCQGWFCNLNTPFGGAVGFAWGTGLGALWPSGGWKPVYRR